MRKLLIVVGLLLTLTAAAGVYKWTDANGKVHYSDRPVEQGELLRLPGGQAPSQGGAAATAGDQPADGQEPPETAGEDGYRLFSFASPEDNQTFRNDAGEVQIGLLLDPSLRNGHQLRLVVDGTPVKGQFASTQLMLRDVTRGTHSLRAEIIDADGVLMGATPEIRFHMRRAAAESP